jgi:hypothetical protein
VSVVPRKTGHETDAIASLRSDAEPSERLRARLAALETEKTKPRTSHPRAWLAVGGVALATLGLGFLALRLSVTPPPPPPAPKLTHNAQLTLEEASTRFWATQKNSRFVLMGDEILERLAIPDSRGRRHRKLQGAAAKKARHAILKEQNATLALVYRALSEEFSPPRQDVYTVNDYSDKNPFDAYYSLGNLFQVASQARADVGDLNGAVDEALNAVALGTKTEKGMQWRGWSAAQTTKYQGLQMLEKLISRLDKDHARHAALKLEALEAKRAPLAEMFVATRWAAYETFRTKSWDQCMFDMVISYGPRSTLALKATPKSWIIAEHLRYLEALEQRARQPYDPKAKPVSVSLDAFNQYMANYLPDAFRQDRFSRTGAALMIARLRRKADPEVRLLDDPFLPGSSLKVRADGLIYSVGPDGIDDGGVALKRTNGPGDVTTLL